MVHRIHHMDSILDILGPQCRTPLLRHPDGLSGGMHGLNLNGGGGLDLDSMDDHALQQFILQRDPQADMASLKSDHSRSNLLVIAKALA